MPPRLIQLCSHAGFLFAVLSNGELWAASVSLHSPQDLRWYPISLPGGVKANE